MGLWFSGLIFASNLRSQDISVVPPQPFHAIELNADQLETWPFGDSRIIYLNGNASISQSQFLATADEAILWVQDSDEDNQTKRVIVYLEGRQIVVRKRRDGQPHSTTGHSEDAIVDSTWLGRLFTRQEFSTSAPIVERNVEPPAILQRALNHHRQQNGARIQQVSFAAQQDSQSVINPVTGSVIQIPDEPPSVPDLNDPSIEIPPSDFRSIEPIEPPQIQSNPTLTAGGAQVDFFPRDPTQQPSLKQLPNPNNSNEQILLWTGGVRVLIRSPEINAAEAFSSDLDGQVVVLADNVVAWRGTQPNGDSRWELYLDGDVIFSKDRRVIYAKQMYYDANFQRGTILDADVYTPIQNFRGLVRLKADVIQQADANHLLAHGAAFTSSRLAFPRYWLQSESIEIERTQTFPNGGLANGLFGASGESAGSEDEYFATSNRNRIYAAGLPVFAWPRFRTRLDDPTLYIKRLRIGNDNIFGFQLLTSWDLYQLLGIRNRPAGSELLGTLDYLGDRGLAFGTESNYRGDSFLGIPGQTRGLYRSWFINDNGLDNLGRERTALVPEEDQRGRILWRHFQRLESGLNVRAELGYISDRNFLESFFEREWDNEKDATTGVWLERNTGSQSLNLIADLQINDFFTQTSWLPRFDQFTIGQPIFGRVPIVHHGRSHIGYGRLRVADAPIDPAELFDPLAAEADVDGVRVGTRQQLEFPQQVGPVKVVPYVLGDVTYWQEDINGDDAFRAFGQLGVRASLPFFKIDSSIENTLFNVNGLAHKASFDVEAFYADSSQDLSRFPLFDNLDDDAQEAFRRRFAFNTFGIMAGDDVPLEFDERFFALRSGLQSDVSASSLEIADDLSIVRLGLRQRWQTKRGIPGNERVIDWISLDVGATLFPDADRDNFGADVGLFNYNFRWFLGDRVSLVSNGFADFFSQGLRTVSVGLQSNRPGVSDTFIGIRSIEGPISSNVLSTAINYRLSDKWGVRANSQIDFGEAGTIGNGLAAIYIGESYLWQFGINADLSRSNVGFRFGFEPRFLQRPRLFRPGAQAIPPPSSLWLE